MNGSRERMFRFLLNKSKEGCFATLWSKIFHFYCLYILGFEFGSEIKIGKNIQIVHGAHGSVVNSKAIIGNNCVIRNNTIIGNNGLGGEHLLLAIM